MYACARELRERVNRHNEGFIASGSRRERNGERERWYKPQEERVRERDGVT